MALNNYNMLLQILQIVIKLIYHVIFLGKNAIISTLVHGSNTSQISKSGLETDKDVDGHRDNDVGHALIVHWYTTMYISSGDKATAALLIVMQQLSIINLIKNKPDTDNIFTINNWLYLYCPMAIKD